MYKIIKLNRAFHSVFTSNSARIGDQLQLSKFCDVRCDPNESFLSSLAVTTKLEELNKNKSVGIDKVHPHVLRECSSSIASSLSKLLRQSYLTSELPQAWREANITPIFKKGSRSDPLNYRPISLTSVTCKVMEKLVKEKIIEHFETN